MLETILNTTILTTALVLLGIATPVLAFFLKRHLHNKRLLLAIGSTGPAFLLLWGIHNLVLETIGFASVWSLFILLILGLGLGVFSGWWIAGGETHHHEKDRST